VSFAAWATKNWKPKINELQTQLDRHNQGFRHLARLLLAQLER
jgi:hypothetical protein